MMAARKRKKPAELARVTPKDLDEQYRRVQEHPIGGLLLDDLAAASQFGSKTARVGVAPDGNPCVIGHNEAAVMAVAKAIQNQKTVHHAVIAPLNPVDFKAMLHGAAKNLSSELPPGARVERLGPATLEDHTHESDGEIHTDDCPNHPRRRKNSD
jgi:hypothetical protein